MAIVACAALSAASGAIGQIAVTAGLVDSYSNGSCGRRGSTTGLIEDNPAPMSGTSGALARVSLIHGGPVPPQEPENVFPGTTCVVDAAHNAFVTFAGGPTFMFIESECAAANAITNMDGPELAAVAGANGLFDYTFTLTASTPYRLSGVAAIDNEDASGSVRMFRGVIPLHGVFNSANGDYSFTGVLTAGTYRVLGNTSVYAAAGAGTNGVGNTGDFGESSTVTAQLVLGCVGVVEQPQNAAACASGIASFSVEAAATAAVTYQWQIEVGPDTWIDLAQSATALPCGGGASATHPDQPATQIEVAPCPGQAEYSVRCVVTASCGNAASESAALVICAADFDCDGFVSGIDFDLYVAAFESGEVSADFDGDGFITGVDFDLFVVAYETGC